MVATTQAEGIAIGERALKDAQEYVDLYRNLRDQVKAYLGPLRELEKRIKLKARILGASLERANDAVESVWGYGIDGAPDVQLDIGDDESPSAVLEAALDAMRPDSLWRDELIVPLRDMLRDMRTTPADEEEDE
jgi:hypothetical protein